MRAIVHNILTFYEMRAEALSVLVANSQKALNEFAPDGKKKASEQAEKLKNFVNDLTMDVNNMLTRFWFQKERKQRKNEPMTDDQVKALADFVSFVKTLSEKVRLLPTRFQKAGGGTPDERLDEEIKEIEAHVKQKLKEFDEVLKETLTDRSNAWKKRLSKCAGNMVSCVAKPFKEESFGGAKLKRAGKSMAEELTKVS